MLPHSKWIIGKAMFLPSEILKHLQDAIVYVERQFHFFVKVVIHDGEPTLLGKLATEFYTTNGIRRRIATAHVHQDGLSLINVTLNNVFARTRSYILYEEVPGSMWLTCALHVMMVMNVLPQAGPDPRSAYEIRRATSPTSRFSASGVLW
jgi:hypothetical protein